MDATDQRPGPRARIVVAAVVEPPPRVDKGALLAQESREEVHRRRRPVRIGGGFCVGVGLAAFAPLLLWGPGGATILAAFGGMLFFPFGLMFLLVAGSRPRPAMLYENGVEWRDSVTNMPGYYPFHFVSEIRQVRLELLGDAIHFKTRAGVNELRIPSGSEFAERAVARAREVLENPPRPEPKMNPFVLKPSPQSSLRANVK